MPLCTGSMEKRIGKKKRMSWEPSEISQCVNVLATKADDLNVIAGIHAVEG